MLRINDDHYSADYFAQQALHFSQLDSLKNIGGERIAVCLDDTALWLALCFYCREQSTSVMPIHPGTPQEAAKRLAQKAGCSRLFFHSLADITTLPQTAQAHAQDAGLIQMSSGTTGEPKCINRSWTSIALEISSYIQTFEAAANMTPVIACPVTHSYGLICGVLVAIERGHTPIIVTNINPKFLIKTLLACEAPVLYSSPTMLQGVIRLWPADAPLHAAMTSGTIMSRQVFEQLRPRITHLFQQYGCSEVGCISINQDLRNPNDIGNPLPHLNVSAGESSDASPDTASEITVTLAATPSGKIIHTQDLGYFGQGADGKPSLYFVARQDDTIIVAGLNVYPQDVEDVAVQHPLVIDALAFKVEDSFAGQRVAVQYVATTELAAHELRQWCDDKLANYQVPQQLVQVDAIERMANGKVSRKKVAREFIDAQQAAKAVAI